jgi:hypothetical protein
MPNLEEHCKHSEKRYGVRGEEIHKWIDEPSQVAGGSHRDYRHDLSSLQTAIQLFGELYGAEMVENIFLDHLRADSQEQRTRAKELIKDGVGSPKLWTEQDDDYLTRNFLIKSDYELEASFSLKGKSKYSIRKRRQYLGLIRPKVIKRTKYTQREQRLVFRLKRGQKFHLKMEIEGGNNDIEFSIYDSKAYHHQPHRIYDRENIEFVPEITANYSFVFSNSFSWKTNKQVKVVYNLENGREIGMEIGL